MAVRYFADDFDVSEWPDAGHVDIATRRDPPSLQAVPATKNAYRESLSAAVARATTKFFTHDVEVTLTWFISEERRYHTHIVADLDNVLKPTIDALVGPDGVLFDDNQVQSIKASWISGTTRGDSGYELRVGALMPDDMISRGGKFVQITPSRCFYVPAMSPDHERRFVDHYVCISNDLANLRSAGTPEDMLRSLEPISRSFPPARLKRFDVLQPYEFR